MFSRKLDLLLEGCGGSIRCASYVYVLLIFSTALCCVGLYCIGLYCVGLYCVGFYCVGFYCIGFYYIALCCTCGLHCAT